jgi:hypothetical protein
MEARLKEDVLREAERYEGAVMVNHETESGEVYDVWEQVTADTVHTPLEVGVGAELDGITCMSWLNIFQISLTDKGSPQTELKGKPKA